MLAHIKGYKTYNELYGLRVPNGTSYDKNHDLLIAYLDERPDIARKYIREERGFGYHDILRLERVSRWIK
jgi:hypothetical protein